MSKSFLLVAVFTLSLGLWLAISSKLSSGQTASETSHLVTSKTEAEEVTTTKASVSPKSSVPTQSTTSHQKEAYYQTPEQSALLALLPLLEGTKIDGHLAANQKGELLVSLQTRDFFDYFLSQASLLEDPWQSIDQIHLLAEEHLPEQAAEEAKQLLDDYLGYQELAYQYLSQPLAPVQEQTPDYQIHILETAQQELIRLRRQVFEPPVVDAFFAMEEAYADYALSRLKLMHNPFLTAEEREAALQKAAEKLPPELRNAEARHHAQLESQ